MRTMLLAWYGSRDPGDRGVALRLPLSVPVGPAGRADGKRSWRSVVNAQLKTRTPTVRRHDPATSVRGPPDPYNPQVLPRCCPRPAAAIMGRVAPLDPDQLAPFAVSGPRSGSSSSSRCVSSSPAGTLHPARRRNRSTTIRRPGRSHPSGGRRPGAAAAGTATESQTRPSTLGADGPCGPPGPGPRTPDMSRAHTSNAGRDGQGRRRPAAAQGRGGGRPGSARTSRA
jgi:hypothetical protein